MLTSAYKDIPISFRWGAGHYTYNFVIDSKTAGISKGNIFANSVDEAMFVVGCNTGNILGWCYINNDVLSLTIQGYDCCTCLLYQE